MSPFPTKEEKKTSMRESAGLREGESLRYWVYQRVEEFEKEKKWANTQIYSFKCYENFLACTTIPLQ